MKISHYALDHRAVNLLFNLPNALLTWKKQTLNDLRSLVWKAFSQHIENDRNRICVFENRIVEPAEVETTVKDVKHLRNEGRTKYKQYYNITC